MWVKPFVVPMLNGQILAKINVFVHRFMHLELVSLSKISVEAVVYFCCYAGDIIITRALGMHGVYCTQPPGFSAIIPRARL